MKKLMDEKDIKDPQLAYYYRQPRKYAETERHINLCMEFTHRPCLTGDDCDLDYACARHKRVEDVVTRYLRMKRTKKERDGENIK